MKNVNKNDEEFLPDYSEIETTDYKFLIKFYGSLFLGVIILLLPWLVGIITIGFWMFK